MTDWAAQPLYPLLFPTRTNRIVPLASNFFDYVLVIGECHLGRAYVPERMSVCTIPSWTNFASGPFALSISQVPR
jgi:hypothetical protein